MNALKANPKVVDLRQLVGGGGYFYGVTARVLELFEEDDVGTVVGEVSLDISGLCRYDDGACWKLACVCSWRQYRAGAERPNCGIGNGSRNKLTSTAQTFKARAAEIADHAHNPRGALGEGVEFLRGLDEMERQCRSHHLSEGVLIFDAPIDCIQYSVLHTIAPKRCDCGWAS